MDDMEENEEIIHDFINYRKWLKYAAGFKIDKTAWNYIYIGALFLAFTNYFMMSLGAVILTVNETVMFFLSIHTFLLVVLPLMCLINCCVNSVVLKETAYLFREGVYKYGHDLPDNKYYEINRKTIIQIREISKMFSICLVIGAFSNVVLLPIMQLLTIDEDTSGKPINPYLPLPLYMPFETRSIFGYTMAFLLNVLYFGALCMIVACTDEVFVTIALQLRAQLQILNHSLLNIENRAIWKILKSDIQQSGIPIANLYKTTAFQNCMFMCLRSNIQHHQALLRMKKSFEKYTGKCFLLIFILSSIVMAGMVLIILENPGTVIIVNFSISLIAEMIFTFHFCWYGELVIEESNKLFEVLYSVPWINCDKRFKVLLSIMMMNTRNPIEMKTTSFHVTASLHTFGNIISTMYQIMNVARNRF